MDTHTKLARVLVSGTKLFIVPGYSETKMQAIAADAGLAVGTLYHLFKSKDDLLNFVFTATLDPDYPAKIRQTPVPPVTTTELIDRTQSLYQAASQDLDMILAADHSATSLPVLLHHLFTTFNAYGAYFLILERNAQITLELVTLYKQYRRQLYQKVTIYLTEMSLNQQIRHLDRPGYDATLLIDQVFWWSAHKKYDSFEREKQFFDFSLAEDTVTQQLLAGYRRPLD